MDKKEYIDREAAVEQIRLGYCTNCNSYNGVRCRACEFGDAMLLIEDVPSADVAPVVHGEWIDKPTGAYGRMQSWCSACGEHSGIGGIERNRHKPYCPNCGAKMDGGNNNG